MEIRSTLFPQEYTGTTRTILFSKSLPCHSQMKNPLNMNSICGAPETITPPTTGGKNSRPTIIIFRRDNMNLSIKQKAKTTCGDMLRASALPLKKPGTRPGYSDLDWSCSSPCWPTCFIKDGYVQLSSKRRSLNSWLKSE